MAELLKVEVGSVYLHGKFYGIGKELPATYEEVASLVEEGIVGVYPVEEPVAEPEPKPKPVVAKEAKKAPEEPVAEEPAKAAPKRGRPKSSDKPAKPE